jgi:hypothetical protein
MRKNDQLLVNIQCCPNYYSQSNLIQIQKHEIQKICLIVIYHLRKTVQKHFSSSRSLFYSWNSTDSCSKWSISPIEILALDIFDKRWKNIFQSADPWLLPETPKILQKIPRWLNSYFPMIDIEILALEIFDKRWKNIFQSADPWFLPKTPQIPALSGAHLRDGLILISQWLILRS